MSAQDGDRDVTIRFGLSVFVWTFWVFIGIKDLIPKLIEALR